MNMKTKQIKQSLKKLWKYMRTDGLSYLIVIAAFVVMQLLRSVGAVSSAVQGQLVPICAYIVMAVSLNLTVGVLGELSLGHASFMSVGAFSGVIAAIALQDVIPMGGVRLAVAMVIGAILAAVFGVIVGVPVLRLRGDYLAIVTLAFGEIIKNIINCLYVGIDANGLHLSVTSAEALGMQDGTVILNGPMGAVGITKLSTFLAGFILVMLCLVIVLNFIRSRAGRAVMAIRDNVIAAESVGISVTRYKLLAFVTSAALAGAAGALYAMNYSTVVATKFNFNTSILVLVFVVLGGLGNIRGSIIAAAVLTILPEMLREFADYRMLVYAVVLIAVMLATNAEGAKRFWARLRPAVEELLVRMHMKKANTAKGE
jgi:branched-chain amino acid transport system permease protein